jgi:hypothetical protein
MNAFVDDCTSPYVVITSRGFEAELVIAKSNDGTCENQGSCMKNESAILTYQLNA